VIKLCLLINREKREIFKKCLSEYRRIQLLKVSYSILIVCQNSCEDVIDSNNHKSLDHFTLRLLLKLIVFGKRRWMSSSKKIFRNISVTDSEDYLCNVSKPTPSIIIKPSALRHLESASLSDPLFNQYGDIYHKNRAKLMACWASILMYAYENTYLFGAEKEMSIIGFFTGLILD